MQEHSEHLIKGKKMKEKSKMFSTEANQNWGVFWSQYSCLKDIKLKINCGLSCNNTSDQLA